MGTVELPTSGRLYCDTNVWIYAIEGIAPYREPLRTVFQAADAGSVSLVSSELCLLETLVKPFEANDAKLAMIFERELRPSAQLAIVPVSRQILVAAARLRALASLRAPDAIHLATAMETGCDRILTNDSRWRTFKGIPVVLLSDLL